MKKSFTLLVLTIFCVGSMFAQEKSRTGKVVPAFQKVENMSIHQTTQLFQEKLQTTDQDQLILKSTFEDELGQVHQKYQQHFNGIPVDGRSVTVHSENGQIKQLTGDFKPLELASTTPSLTKAGGLQAAMNHIGATKYAWQGDECNHKASSHEGHGHDHDFTMPEGELVIFAHPSDKTLVRLAYKYDIYASEPLYRAYVYVDANSGEVLFENNRIHHTDEGGTCTTLYNGTQNITVDNTGSLYRLRQTTDGNGIETYDMNNGTNYSNASDVTSSSPNFTATSTHTANQAHFGAEQTHQYFMSQHSRNSYNGAGAIIKSYVSYSSNYVNAFWDGSRMTYGDGDGVNYGPLVSLDIVGHEIAHGVTEYTANLVYSYESGALNESFSDIFGESIENYATGTNDWLMGDQIGAGGSGGALRSMSNPNTYGDPDTYLGTNWYSGSGDNGGVHYNSGVQNKWFYILTEGESGTNDNGDAYAVSGIGMTAAGAIAYRNLSVYLSSSSNYAAARAGAIQSAIDLYGAGSDEEIATTDAWYAVGVGDPYGPPPPVTCVEEDMVLTITFDNYPEETSWTVKNASGTTVASGGTYASQADGSTLAININGLTAGDYTFTINDSYGDGICCAYGNGSYTLDAASGNVASGGSFGSAESTTFCTEAGPPACTPGDSCDDGDVCTTGDVFDSNCNCAGTYADSDGDGTCDAEDLCNGGDEPGTSCNDGDPLTTGDVILADCSCAGTPLCTPGNSCDDGDDCTEGDAYDTNCNCVGTYADSDGDGTCDAEDLCAGPEPGASCDDGDANTTGDIVQSDCSCAGTPTGGSTLVFGHYFESGWDGWADGGSDCARYSGSRSWEGNRSIRIRDNSGTASSMTSSAYNLSGYSSVDLEFYFYAYSMENNEDFWVRYYNGSSWTTVATYVRGTTFENNTFYVATVTLSANDYNMASNAQFRFQCDASGNNDHVYIDAVTLTGNTGSSLLATTSGQTIKPLTGPAYDFEADLTNNDFDTERLSVYPNPTNSELNIRLVEGASVIRIYSITGSLLLEQIPTASRESIDVSNLQPGTYFIAVEANGEILHEKFVKL